MYLRLILILIACVFVSSDTAAQSSASDQNSLLPEINPQDIEIRSEFRARFPGLRRQPILGFNPKPRVFQVDPYRMPFMESRDEAVASMAITQLDRPEPPERTIIEEPKRRAIFSRAGIGNFTTPEFNGVFFQNLTTKSNISGKVDYSSSKGHLDSHLSSFRFLSSDLRFFSKLNRNTQIEANLGGNLDFNRLYDLAPFYQVMIGETALKKYAGLNGGVSFKKIKNALEGSEASFKLHTYNSDIEAGTTDLGGSSNEIYIVGAFKKNWLGNRLYETFGLLADFKLGNYENSLKNSNTVSNIGIDAEYKKLLNFNLHVSGKVGLRYVSDGISDKIYFSPKILIAYNLKDALFLKGGLSGIPQVKSLIDHFETNRFLNNELILQHSYQSKAFVEAGIQLVEGNRLYGGLDYSSIKDRAYYDRKIETIWSETYQLFYELKYDKVTEFEYYAGVTQQINPQKFWFHIHFYARQPKLENNEDVPYEERIGINSSISYKPTNKLLVTAWADYIGNREAPSVNEELSAFTLASIHIDYEITDKLGVYTKGLNILSQKYEIWDGYQERPFQVFGGVILKF